MLHSTRTTCRGCDATELVRFLELGDQPLANALLESPEDAAGQPRFPLDLWFCTRCTLVQLLDVVDPEHLFGHYIYVTGTSSTMAAHNAAYADAVVRELGLGADRLVVEVASNDGSLLCELARHGLRTLGIEPARNVAALARERGVETVCAFFDEELGARIARERGPAAAVLANNVLAHVDNTLGFLRGLAAVAGAEGTCVVEAPYVGPFVERLEYDTVYHEHLCYFSIAALANLYERAGLSIVRIDHVSVHGGSMRVWARSRASVPRHAGAVTAEVAREAERGLAAPERYRRMGEEARAARDALVALVAQLRAEGARIAAYGAPAKGNTLLNFCGLDATAIEFTVDKNPLKVGRFLPGSRIPVLAVEELAARRPDYALLLPWNIADEIRAQESDFAAAGGRFLLPIPEPTIL